MSNQKKEAPFGLWPSPVTPKMVGQGYRLSDVQWDSDGESLVWMEDRSNHGVLVLRKGDGAARDLTVDENVRAWVGYGGGNFGVSQGTAFFVDIDGRIYRRSLEPGITRPITPAFGRTASPVLSPDGRWVLFVFSDGEEDLLAMVDAEGNQWPHQVSKGADFYMQPTWSPDGKQIAWVEWDHPNMPWDETRIKLGKLDTDFPRLVEEKVIALETDWPAVEPLFSPDGRWLSYITSNGEWEDLILLNLESGEKRVLIHGDGYMLSYPAWAQGRHSYGWSPAGDKLYTMRIFAGRTTLWKVDVASGEAIQIDTGEYTNISQLSVSPVHEGLAFLATAPHLPDRVVRWDQNGLKVISHSTAENLPAAFMPPEKLITWKASDGMSVFAHFYPPAHPEYTGKGLPPALVYVHGGPTGGSPVGYSAMRNYFTSRGYAFLDVDYRGSAGYGLTYQRSMRQRWGDVDTEDADGAVQALIDQGLADGDRVAIIGGSAGGYLVLNALVHHPGRFKAGINLYGVSNLFNLALETHKFESRYLDSMVGPLPEAAERYRAFSPIFHADQIKDPIAIFQGAIDPVVLPNQSEDILEILQRNGVPTIYRKYEGEGHGFRKMETQIDFLEQTERFLQQHVLFT